MIIIYYIKYNVMESIILQIIDCESIYDWLNLLNFNYVIINFKVHY